jgi:hypothetical protein
MIQKKKRGSGGKPAPPGYYTLTQACAVLGLAKSTFNYYVKIGKITRYIPPLRSEGFYLKSEIDRMATEMALFFHTKPTSTGGVSSVQTRVATPEDTPGIADVLFAMGWPTANAERRVSWYGVNPWIDYVVTRDGEVMGYINACPYRPEALDDMMSGRKRSWHIEPSDILPYQSGWTYDLYVGIATRQNVPGATWLSFRLISGFLSFLQELASRGITIRRLYAVNAEPDGQKLCHDLGFSELPAEMHDRFPRFLLDLETSDTIFARQYRDAIGRV